VYALPERQLLLAIDVPAGTRARDALRLAKIEQHFPELDILVCPLGVFGQPVEEDFVLRAGDRLEVYRPLLNDPREQRRDRARRGSNMGQSAKRSD
jgi:putative ubiquitin-RnfH superfamily antitoxin RatB of RatAB toxin-antitoxin module